MKCTKCGREFNGATNFCPYCGSKVEMQNKSVNNNQQKKAKQLSLMREFSNVKLLSICGMIVGALLLFIIISLKGISGSISSNSLSDSMSSISSAIQSLKLIPPCYYIAMVLCLYVCVFSIINARKHKDIKTTILAGLSGINILLLFINFKTISTIQSLLSLDLSDVFSGKISSGLVSDAYNILKNPEETVNSLALALGFGAVVLAYSIYLFVTYYKKEQQTYETISLNSLKKTNVSNNQTNKKDTVSFTRKKKTIGGVVIALLLAMGIGYYIWDDYLNYTNIDLAKNISLTYKGISGEAYIDDVTNNVEYDKSNKEIADFVNSIEYNYSKDENLENGDSVTVTTVYNKDTADKLKLHVTSASKVIKVENLIHRFKEAKEVPKDTIALIKDKALTYLKNEYTNDYYETYRFSYCGTYLVKYNKKDSLVAVFKDNHTSKDYYDTVTTSTDYYYYEITNVNSDLNNETFGNYSTYKSMLKDNEDEYIKRDDDIASSLHNINSEITEDVIEVD